MKVQSKLTVFALGVVSLTLSLAVVFGLLPAGVSPAPLRVLSLPRTGQPVSGARQADPEAQRAAVIRDTISALSEECQRCAGGDWDRWLQQLSDYRTSLRARIDAAKPFNLTATGTFEARAAVLEAKDEFPLCELAPVFYLRHVYEPESLESFRNEQPVVAGARWLKQRGIDVIFVPVPKMTEVYPEHFAERCPTDRIVAPQMRRLILELLESGIEVVDLLPAFLAEADKDPAPLYQPADPHWTPRAQAIAARAIAGRLMRYAFVKQALSERPRWQSIEADYPPAGSGTCFEALNPDQRRRAEQVHPRTYRVARMEDGPQFAANAPVAFIGDSYNGGLMELVSLEINMLINSFAGGGNTTDAFKNFLRNPSVLKDCKVVVWLVCNSSLENPWPIPPPVREAMEPAGQK
jgi:hypothetical protein